jgi:hypothetical protein
MFGKHWVAARGTVVDRRVASTSGDGSVVIYEYVIDVRTVEGELFRAKVGEPRISTNFLGPMVGRDVGVEYERKSRDVRFDKNDPTLSMKAYEQAQTNHFDATLQQAPGTRPTPATPVLPTGLPLDPAQIEQIMAAARAAAARATAARAAGSGAAPAPGTAQVFTTEQVFGPSGAVSIDPDSPQGIALREALAQFLPPPDSTR